MNSNNLAINWTTGESNEPAGLIFDCDGTLADTMPLHFRAWKQTLDRFGLQFSEDRFYAMAGQPTVHIIRILLKEQGLEFDADEIAEEKESAFLGLLPQVKPITPVVEVAKHFQTSKPMGVGSGSNREVVKMVLETIGLPDFFQVIVGAEDVEQPKPAPDVFLKVAQGIQVPADECCVYEDADLGIEAARRGGMTTFDIRTIYTPQRMTPKN
ncbi:MAG: beta-phosphoglucomutase family hydrolase [Planctomycetota bacterium]